MTKRSYHGQLPAVIPLRQALPIGLLCWLPSISAAGEPDAYPRVYRTFMPESGPSAFAVELSPKLALCYDPLRGGVNRIWTGGINLAPTRLAKINNTAKIIGTEFYRETLEHPLRIGSADADARYRFKGYRYKKGAVTFEFTLAGQPVTETLRVTKDGRGLMREFHLSKQAVFSQEKQSNATVTIRGGRELKPGQWRFAAGKSIRIVITPKP